MIKPASTEINSFFVAFNLHRLDVSSEFSLTVSTFSSGFCFQQLQEETVPNLSTFFLFRISLRLNFYSNLLLLLTCHFNIVYNSSYSLILMHLQLNSHFYVIKNSQTSIFNVKQRNGHISCLRSDFFLQWTVAGACRRIKYIQL